MFFGGSFLDKTLRLIYPIKWMYPIAGIIMLLGTIYQVIETPDDIGSYITLAVVVIVSPFFYLRSVAFFDVNDDGVVESKWWTFVYFKKYRYHGLAKAKAVILQEGDYTYAYLLFGDGYKLPIPGDPANIEVVKAWFKKKYNIELEMITPGK